jgi:hypothetical protein
LPLRAVRRTVRVAVHRQVVDGVEVGSHVTKPELQVCCCLVRLRHPHGISRIRARIDLVERILHRNEEIAIPLFRPEPGPSSLEAVEEPR